MLPNSGCNIWFALRELCEEQRICSFASSLSNIQINISPSRKWIWQQFDELYTPHVLANTGYNSRFSLRELWSLWRLAYLQFCKLTLKYSNQYISVSKVDMAIIRRALYSTNTGKYSVQHPICATSAMVTIKSNIRAVLQILCLSLKSAYPRFNWWCNDNTMCVLPQIYCQNRCTTSGLRYVNYCLCEDQRICNFANYLLNIQINRSPFRKWT